MAECPSRIIAHGIDEFTLPLPEFGLHHNAHKLLFVGDVQRTSWMESVFLGRKQNDKERESILHRLGQEIQTAQYTTMVMLGDQVCYGEDHTDWNYFDAIMTPVYNAAKHTRTPLFALPGNHDYGMLRKTSRNLSQLFQRFPETRKNFPAVLRAGSAVIVLLDSNFDELPQNVIQQQYSDYQKLLALYDADPAVRSVIVAAHHPPYSNSMMGRHNLLEQTFAQPFMNARKTTLFLSGHVHSYERFEFQTAQGNKTFVVSGGGGGPRRSVRTDDKRPYPNDQFCEGTIRPFHYISVSINESELQIDVMMLGKNSWFYQGDRCIIPVV